MSTTSEVDQADGGVDDPWPITGRLTPEEHGYRTTTSPSFGLVKPNLFVEH